MADVLTLPLVAGGLVLGAWTGLARVGTVLAARCYPLGLVVLRLAGQQTGADTPVPFGARLAAGIWLTWLYGPLLLG